MIYLTAQRVVSPRGLGQGVNSFRYQQHRAPIPGASLLGSIDRDPGTLTSRSVVLPPPGNNVRSYVDIVVPDDATEDQLAEWIEDFIRSVLPDQPMPWSRETGHHAIRFLCERSLALVWDQEVRFLSGATTVLLG
jgi:hypothetical protein